MANEAKQETVRCGLCRVNPRWYDDALCRQCLDAALEASVPSPDAVTETGQEWQTVAERARAGDEAMRPAWNWAKIADQANTRADEAMRQLEELRGLVEAARATITAMRLHPNFDRFYMGSPQLQMALIEYARLGQPTGQAGAQSAEET